jgi:hypothetical protein
MFEQKPLQYIFLSITLLLYFVIGFAFPRYETSLLLISYGTLFGIYCWIIFRIKENEVQFWFYASILFRFSLLFSVPTLSDDFYRFIWDGRLLASGYHPFSHVPSYYIENKISIPGIEEALFINLNSKNYFTVYPPVAQFIFWISAACSSSIYGSLLILKMIIFLSEIGSIILIQKLLSHFKFPVTRLFVYALNPLVILELSGNAHLEGVMIFFLLLSLYLLIIQKFFLSTIVFATSICIKLIPLLFLPALLPLFGFKKAMLFYLSVLLTCLIFSLPLWDLDILTGYQSSFSYYFSKFEFNASIYYVVRELGFLLFGYNIIQTAGWILGVLAGILILLVATHWLRAPHAWYFKYLKNQSSSNNTVLTFIYLMMWSLFIYFLFTTTLHPWYITTLLALSVFTDFRFVIVWTAVIFLTYAGYDWEAFRENLWIVAFEYATILGYLAYELARKRNQAILTA